MSRPPQLPTSHPQILICIINFFNYLSSLHKTFLVLARGIEWPVKGRICTIVVKLVWTENLSSLHLIRLGKTWLVYAGGPIAFFELLKISTPQQKINNIIRQTSRGPIHSQLLTSFEPLLQSLSSLVSYITHWTRQECIFPFLSNSTAIQGILHHRRYPRFRVQDFSFNTLHSYLVSRTMNYFFH